jgi:hypothetical protein
MLRYNGDGTHAEVLSLLVLDRDGLETDSSLNRHGLSSPSLDSYRLGSIARIRESRSIMSRMSMAVMPLGDALVFIVTTKVCPDMPRYSLAGCELRENHRLMRPPDP